MIKKEEKIEIENTENPTNTILPKNYCLFYYTINYILFNSVIFKRIFKKSNKTF